MAEKMTIKVALVTALKEDMKSQSNHMRVFSFRALKKKKPFPFLKDIILTFFKDGK